MVDCYYYKFLIKREFKICDYCEDVYCSKCADFVFNVDGDVCDFCCDNCTYCNKLIPNYRNYKCNKCNISSCESCYKGCGNICKDCSNT